MKSIITNKPGILKSKFLTVLGNSNELLNRISNRLDINLSLSSSDSDYCDDDEEEQPEETIDFSTIDFDARRVKSRRAHEEIISGRFRHPNLIPRTSRNSNNQDDQHYDPNLHPNSQQQQQFTSSDSSESFSSIAESADNHSRPSSSYSNQNSNNSISTNPDNIENKYNDTNTDTNTNTNVNVNVMKPLILPEIDIIDSSTSQLLEQTKQKLSSLSLSIQSNNDDECIRNINNDTKTDIENIPKVIMNNDPKLLLIDSNIGLQANTLPYITTNPNTMKILSNSSTLTSLNDPAVPITVSIDSSDLRNWIRSESENSVPSWASSISLDSHTEETVKEFMKQFINILFRNSSEIALELKSEFGIKARLMSGRLWFTRFVNSQRSKSKKTDETTFFSLVQYFAIILFECAESEDYSPAKTLMNMCFTFYHEIEVPGCEPYREYLFTYLRQQPIWHTLRFWDAAYFDVIQCQRAQHSVSKCSIKNKRNQRCKSKEKQLQQQQQNQQEQLLLSQPSLSANLTTSIASNSTATTNNINNSKKLDRNHSLPQSDNENSASTSSASASKSISKSSASEYNENAIISNQIHDDLKYQQNITFGLLGTFTCNMHSFGLNKELCLDFLKKHSIIANLPKEHEKQLRDNINRMYHETEKWGA